MGPHESFAQLTHHVGVAPALQNPDDDGVSGGDLNRQGVQNSRRRPSSTFDRHRPEGTIVISSWKGGVGPAGAGTVRPVLMPIVAAALLLPTSSPESLGTPDSWRQDHRSFLAIVAGSTRLAHQTASPAKPQIPASVSRLVRSPRWTGSYRQPVPLIWFGEFELQLHP